MPQPTQLPSPNAQWLSFVVRGKPGEPPQCFEMETAVHTISLTVRGHHGIRRISGGRETAWHETAGCVNFVAATGDHSTFLTETSPDFVSAVFLIPREQLAGLLLAEGGDLPAELHDQLWENDPVLRRCLGHLAAGDGIGGDARFDELSRRLVLRLAELFGGRPPDWWSDSGGFSQATLTMFTERIDTDLRHEPSLIELASLTGLSPGHVARKFRQTTGVSLHIYCNLRRIQAAFTLLQTRRPSLCQLSDELGFSSQSHFTRLFRTVTGMTPAAYRRAVG